jgi:hypothetical protein
MLPQDTGIAYATLRTQRLASAARCGLSSGYAADPCIHSSSSEDDSLCNVASGAPAVLCDRETAPRDRSQIATIQTCQVSEDT